MFPISFHLAHILAISIQENTCGTCYCRKVTLISTSKEILEAHLSLHGNKTNKSAPDMVPNAAGNSNMWASTGTRVRMFCRSGCRWRKARKKKSKEASDVLLCASRSDPVTRVPNSFGHTGATPSLNFYASWGHWT